MKIWLYLGLAGSIGFAVLLLSIVGIQPKPVRLIKPSKFENHMAIGQAVYQRLFPNINESLVIIFVSTPDLPEHNQVWSGVLTAIKKYNKIEMDLLEFRRPESIQEYYDFDRILDSDDPQLAVEYIREYLENKEENKTENESSHKKLIVHLNLSDYEAFSDLTSYIDAAATVTAKGKTLVFLYQSYFAVEEAKLQAWPKKCLVDNKGLSNQLICLSEKVSRKYFSKKLAKENLTATLEQFSAQKFAIFFTP